MTSFQHALNLVGLLPLSLLQMACWLRFWRQSSLQKCYTLFTLYSDSTLHDTPFTKGTKGKFHATRSTSFWEPRHLHRDWCKSPQPGCQHRDTRRTAFMAGQDMDKQNSQLGWETVFKLQGPSTGTQNTRVLAISAWKVR